MAWYLIRAAAQQAGVSPETVRDYCRKGLLTPVRDSAGRRLFTQGDIERIRDIYVENVNRRAKAHSRERDVIATAGRVKAKRSS